MSKPFEVAIGLNYGDDNKRAEIGDVVSDLPEDAIEDLLTLGAIRPVQKKKGK